MDELVSRYHGRLLDFAFRRLGDRESAADIAQSVLLKVFESAARYEPKGTFRAWVYTIALNMIRDEARKVRARRECFVPDINEELPPQAEAHSLEQEAFYRMRSADIWGAVADLREDHKVALILRFREGLSYDEIAQVMDAPSGTVRSWIHYAMRTLRKSLATMDGEDEL
jgi:RNA polymerase sigma-70 factor, ECF subfamily